MAMAIFWTVCSATLVGLAVLIRWIRHHTAWERHGGPHRVEPFTCKACEGYGEQWLGPDPDDSEREDGMARWKWQPVPRELREDGPHMFLALHRDRDARKAFREYPGKESMPGMRVCTSCHGIGHHWERLHQVKPE